LKWCPCGGGLGLLGFPDTLFFDPPKAALVARHIGGS